jgi:hypothetical protein
VSSALARAIPQRAAGWLSFAIDDHAVRALAAGLTGWLGADPALRARAPAWSAQRANAGPGRAWHAA